MDIYATNTHIMKVKSSIKKEKAGDQLVRRRGKLYRINKKDPRRKARQG